MSSRFTLRRLTAACIALGSMVALVSCARADDEASLFKAAAASHKAKDYETATELYTKFAAQYPASPDAPEALLMLGYVKLRATPNATSEIVDAFTRVRTVYPLSPEAGEALVRIGYIHGRTDAATAIKDFQNFLSTYKDHPLVPEVQLTLGRLHARNNEWDKAEAAFRTAQELPSASAQIKEEAALAGALVNTERYFRSGDRKHLDKTIEALEKLTSACSLWVRANADLGIAESLLYQAKYPEALEKYKAAVETYKKEPYYRVLSLFGAGSTCQVLSKTQDASDYFEGVLAAVPGNTITEKDKAWRDAALQVRPVRVRERLQKEGSSFHGDTVLCQSAWSHASSLYTLKKYDDAIGILNQLLQCEKASKAIKFSAQRLLKSCEKAKGGK